MKGAAGSQMAGIWQALGAALVLAYHFQAGQTISCKIIGSAANFLLSEGLASAPVAPECVVARLQQVVVEAVDHFNGIEQHNAPACAHNKPRIAKLLQGGADCGLGGADHGGQLLLRNAQWDFAGFVPALGGAKRFVGQRNEQACQAVGHVSLFWRRTRSPIWRSLRPSRVMTLRASG